MKREQREDFHDDFGYEMYIDRLFEQSCTKAPCAQCKGQTEKVGSRYCGICGRDLRQTKEKGKIHEW